MSSVESLRMPILMLFENHMDTAPKEVLKETVFALSCLGYNIIALEVASSRKSDEIMASHRDTLQVHLKLYEETERILKINVKDFTSIKDTDYSSLVNQILWCVSTKAEHVTQIVKCVPASKITAEIFELAKKNSMEISGVDIDMTPITSELDFVKRSILIDKYEDIRIETMVKNLLELTAEGKGVIFQCGALHAGNLLARFTALGMRDRLLPYFPISLSFQLSLIKVSLIHAGDSLVGHTYPLTEKMIRPFCRKMISDIASSITYVEFPEGNSHTLFLSKVFRIGVRLFVHAGYVANAFLEIDGVSHAGSISKQLDEAEIPNTHLTLKGRKYIVIIGVNNRKVAERVWKSLSP